MQQCAPLQPRDGLGLPKQTKGHARSQRPVGSAAFLIDCVSLKVYVSVVLMQILLGDLVNPSLFGVSE